MVLRWLSRRTIRSCGYKNTFLPLQIATFDNWSVGMQNHFSLAEKESRKSLPWMQKHFFSRKKDSRKLACVDCEKGLRDSGVLSLSVVVRFSPTMENILM